MFRKFLIYIAAGLGLAVRPLAAQPAPPMEVQAIPHVLLADMNSGQVLYASRADERFLPASVTKVMTAYVAFDLIDSGKLHPRTLFQVSDEVARIWSGQGTTLWLKAGERLPVDTLLRGITIASANDASIALAEGFAGDLPRWQFMMNAHAQRLGMTNSHFNTPNGLPDEGRTYVTARDLQKLASALIQRHPKLYRTYFGRKSMEWRNAEYWNRDPTLGVVQGADGIKTGHTNEAGYNFLGSAERDGRRLVMVIGGAPSNADRSAASRALLEWGFSAWKPRKLFARGSTIATVHVQDGDARRVPVMAPMDVFADIPINGDNMPIKLRVVYEGPLRAPVAKGREIARLEIRVGDMAPGTVPLYAERSVRRADWLDRIWNGLYGLFA